MSEHTKEEAAPGPAEEEAPQGKPEPGYPRVNVNVNLEGIQITTKLAPGLTLTQAIGPELTDRINELWIKEKGDEAIIGILTSIVKNRGGHEDGRDNEEKSIEPSSSSAC